MFSALAVGCTGIEADIWLSEDGQDILVGHDRASLSADKTLQSMYLNPLLDILNRRNSPAPNTNITDSEGLQGIFTKEPSTPVILMIDVKEHASVLWPLVIQQLEPLRQQKYLTRYEKVYPAPGIVERQTMWPGPLVIVGSGDMSLSLVAASYANGTRPYGEYHDTFLDAPLDTLPSDNMFWSSSRGGSKHLAENATRVPGVLSLSQTLYYPENAYYASVSFKQSIGSVHFGFTDSQLNKLREQIRIAKLSHLHSRYWDIPDWPINYRDYIWEVLVREGVGMLSIDDVDAASRRAWTLAYRTIVSWAAGVSVYIALVFMIVWVGALCSLRLGYRLFATR